METIQKYLNDKILEDQEKRKTRVRSGCWSPSSLGRCYRLQYWNRKNEPETNPSDVASVKRMQLGTLVHDWIQSKYPKEEVEVEVKKNDVLGYADLVQGDTVTDIKTTSPWAFKWFDKKDFDIAEEKFCNWLQVATYCTILGKSKMRLFFVNIQDIHKTQEYTQNLVDWIEPLTNEFKQLRYFWDNEELPPAEPRAYNGNDCKYCSWRDKCETMEGKQ